MENQFKKLSTPLDDVYVLERFCHSDDRGVFTKTFNLNMFRELEIGGALEIKESLCSTSKKDVLRGMHYQQYPYSAAKIVSVVKGRILDVIVGIGGKFNTRNRGKIYSVELSDTNAKSLYIPDGYAHGFLVLSEEAVVVYHQTNHFNAASDKGIHFNSFGFEWPVTNPIVSEKDLELPGINEFKFN
jgi:dTDP-4-dehydrorhamnose 3,5-epimerase